MDGKKDEKKPETVGEMMARKSEEYAAKMRAGVGVIAEREVSRVPLQGSSPYAFCPKCAVRNTRGYGSEWRAHMRPLWAVRFKMLIRLDAKTGKVAWETRWQCPECREWPTYDDFISVWCTAPGAEEQKFVDLTKCNLDDPMFARYF